MITIYFEAHSTTYDNEAGIASGHNDAELSEAGRRLAADEKARRYDDVEVAAVFASDLRRAYDTATIMFGHRDIPLFVDPRLRECDYGDLTGRPRLEVEVVRARSITQPFPNGESYQQAMDRIKSFLDELSESYQGQSVVVIGHGATRCGLEHWLNGVPIAEALGLPTLFHGIYQVP